MAPRKQVVNNPQTMTVTESFSLEGINESFVKGIECHAEQIEQDLIVSFNNVINKYNMSSLTKSYVIHMLMKNWNVTTPEDNSDQFKHDVMFKLLKNIAVSEE